MVGLVIYFKTTVGRNSKYKNAQLVSHILYKFFWLFLEIEWEIAVTVVGYSLSYVKQIDRLVKKYPHDKRAQADSTLR